MSVLRTAIIPFSVCEVSGIIERFSNQDDAVESSSISLDGEWMDVVVFLENGSMVGYIVIWRSMEVGLWI